MQTSGRRGRQPHQRRRRWGPRSAVGARSGQPGAEATGPGALLSRSACRRDPEDRSVRSRPQQLYRCRRWSDGPGGWRCSVSSDAESGPRHKTGSETPAAVEDGARQRARAPALRAAGTGAGRMLAVKGARCEASENLT